MSRRSTFVTLTLTAAVAFLVGTIFAGGITRSAVVAGPDLKNAGRRSGVHPAAGLPPGTSVNFADVVDRINPAVVSIDATSKGRGARRRNRTDAPEPPDIFDPPFDFTPPRRDNDRGDRNDR